MYIEYVQAVGLFFFSWLCHWNERQIKYSYSYQLPSISRYFYLKTQFSFHLLDILICRKAQNSN